MIFGLPVYQRASLIAFSFASAPPFVKKAIARWPGVTSANKRASVDRGSLAIGGPIGRSFSARPLLAPLRLGGWGPRAGIDRPAPEAGGGLAPEVPKERRPGPPTGNGV